MGKTVEATVLPPEGGDTIRVGNAAGPRVELVQRRYTVEMGCELLSDKVDRVRQACRLMDVEMGVDAVSFSNGIETQLTVRRVREEG